MTHTSTRAIRTSRAGIALAAMAALAALAGTSSWAAPPAGVPTFASASLDIAAGNGGPEAASTAGGLTCGWRETGLQPFQLITYACDAAVVGALEGCVYKNKLVAGTATQLSVIRNPQASHEGGEVGFISNNSGRINGTTTTAVPVSEGHGGHLCVEPAQAEVIAVRWCDASLTDTVNQLVGATMTELFRQFYSGAASVPTCFELQSMAPTALR